MLSLNPWIYIWIHPRKTIKQIVAHNPNFRLWVLATVVGFSSLMFLEQIFSPAFKYSLSSILLFSLIIAPFWGYFILSFLSFLVFRVGRIMDSKRSYSDVRAALSWACVPFVITCLCWLSMLIVFKEQLFEDFPQNIDFLKWQVSFVFVNLLIKLVMIIWSLIIYIQVLSFIQEFSVKKTILNIAFVGAILTVIIFLLWAAIVNTCGHFFDVPLITVRF